MRNGFGGFLRCVSKIVRDTFAKPRGPFRFSNIVNNYAQVSQIEWYVIYIRRCKYYGLARSMGES